MALRWLAAGLFVLTLWNVLLTSEVSQRRIEAEAAITLLPPTSPPPPPPSHPPKKVVSQQMAGSALAGPTAKLAPPKPKAPNAHMPVVARHLILETPPDPTQFSLPQGTDKGIVIGGDGGGGTGCGGKNFYLPLITSQLRSVFMRNEKTDTRTFQVQALLWFNGTGNVQRAELAKSTGDAGLNMTVTHLLGEINVGGNVPECLQPITVWVSEPWKVAMAGGSGEKQTDQPKMGTKDVVIWQTAPRQSGR
jgi:hypothetical protein